MDAACTAPQGEEPIQWEGLKVTEQGCGDQEEAEQEPEMPRLALLL